MAILKEFREFAVRGNVVDMAVGIIIGAAFGKIVSSLVDDVIMPPIGVVIGGVDFSDLAVTLKQAQDGAPAVLLKYGMFLQTCLNFLIVAMAVFMLVKLVNTLRRLESNLLDEAKADASAPPPAPTPQEKLLMEIRDLLRESKA